MKGYEVALGNKIEALIEEVERLGALGYEPQGGIAVSESYGRLAQAMVLRTGGPLMTEASVTVYPAEMSLPAAGGSGSVNLSIVSPGVWEVDPHSVPIWITLIPTGPQLTDQQILITAAPNTTGASRTAVVHVNADKFTVNQAS